MVVCDGVRSASIVRHSGRCSLQPFYPYGADKKIRDFVHVDDVVVGLLAVAQCGEPGAACNLGSGQGHSLRSLIRIIEDASGRAAAVEIDDKDLTDSYPLVADIARLQILGFIPSVILAEGWPSW